MSSLVPEEGEYLTTGWEHDLGAADSLLRQGVLAHVSWAHALAHAAGGTTADTPGWGAGSSGHPSPMLNWAIVKRPPADWAAVVDEVLAWLPADAGGLLVCAFPTSDLRGHGLVLLGHPPLMYRPATGLDRPLKASIDIRRADTSRQRADAQRVFVEGFPMPDLADIPPGEFYRPELGADTAVFVGYDGDEPVATSVAHAAAGVTVVENVAVLARARGRGAGAAITWAATSVWPDRPAMLIASDDGQPVYERLGYLRLLRLTCWMHPAPATD